MSKKQSGLRKFLAEHQAVLVQMFGDVSAEEVDALLEAPLATLVGLLARRGLAPLSKQLAALVAGAGATEREEGDEETRELMRGSVPSLIPPPPPPPESEAPPVRSPAPPPSAPAAAAPSARPAPKHTARAKPPMRGGDVLLGAEPPPRVARGITRAKPPEKTDDEKPEVRYLVAGIAGHENDEPLELKKYVLEVSVELEKSGDAATRFLDAGVTHAAGEESITLMVQVTSEDFVVSQKTAMALELPRRGPSDGKARFDVKPKAEGRGTLTINVHKDGNFLLQMEVAYSIGAAAAAPVEKKVHGRTLTSAAQLRKRDLGMTINPAAGGYECIVRGSTYTSVILKIDEARLADAIRVARDAMLGVVKQREDGVAVFQGGAEFATSDANPQGTRVSSAAETKALTTLARAGGALFQVLFAGRKAGADEKAIGELLKKCALRSDKQLTLQIVAERFPVPWGVLYLGSIAEDAELSWDNFLGLRCIIEQIPLKADSIVDDSDIPSDHPALVVGVNVNESIDSQFSLDVVKRQLDFWNDEAKAAGSRLTFATRTSRGEVLKALSGHAPDQLMYLYCHAETNGPDDPGGISGSCFVFTGDERITLADLDAEAANLPALPGNPLVFINACESGELRPEFYDGFIPYFMSKGARGVIGTECQTPAIFATEWALRFFPRFLAGEPIGELFLGLRREFLERHGNPLGLLYNVYCDGDTQVQPGLTL
jgi:hypothetical protein